MLDAMIARVVENSACRSRWMTCVESVAGLQPELLADVPLDPRVEVRMRADGPAQFANTDPSECLRETFFGARPNSSNISASFSPKVIGSA